MKEIMCSFYYSDGTVLAWVGFYRLACASFFLVVRWGTTRTDFSCPFLVVRVV